MQAILDELAQILALTPSLKGPIDGTSSVAQEIDGSVSVSVQVLIDGLEYLIKLKLPHGTNVSWDELKMLRFDIKELLFAYGAGLLTGRIQT